MVHFKKHCNTYGSLASFLIAFFFRAAGGEDVLSLPALIEYPYYDEVEKVQLFPFRTLCMIISLVVLVAVSKTAEILFRRGILEEKHDYFKCFIGPEIIGDAGKSSIVKALH